MLHAVMTIIGLYLAYKTIQNMISSAKENDHPVAKEIPDFPDGNARIAYQIHTLVKTKQYANLLAYASKLPERDLIMIMVERNTFDTLEIVMQVVYGATFHGRNEFFCEETLFFASEHFNYEITKGISQNAVKVTARK